MENIIISRTWRRDALVQVDNLAGAAFCGEEAAHTFQISGVDASGGAVAITGTITGELLNANNATVTMTGSVSDGVASLTLTDECYDAPGRYILTIWATDGTTTACIYCAIGNIMRSSSDTVYYPTASIPDLAALLQEVQAAISIVQGTTISVTEDDTNNGLVITTTTT